MYIQGDCRKVNLAFILSRDCRPAALISARIQLAKFTKSSEHQSSSITGQLITACTQRKIYWSSYWFLCDFILSDSSPHAPPLHQILGSPTCQIPEPCQIPLYAWLIGVQPCYSSLSYPKACRLDTLNIGHTTKDRLWGLSQRK